MTTTKMGKQMEDVCNCELEKLQLNPDARYLSPPIDKGLSVCSRRGVVEGEEALESEPFEGV